MGLFSKKADPISDRTRALNAEIAALEAEIKQLSVKSERAAGKPPQRPISGTGKTAKSASTTAPIFEPIDRRSATGGNSESPAHFNELGVRKFDLLGAWQRVRGHFHSNSTANPKLVSYLAAGSVKGLRPLRYEKRVARNRFIALSLFFLIVLWGILALIFSHR